MTRTCQTPIGPVSLCSLAVVGLDDRVEPACDKHATYRFNVDARPLVDDTPASAWLRAMWAAHEARVLNPELREHDSKTCERCLRIASAPVEWMEEL